MKQTLRVDYKNTPELIRDLNTILSQLPQTLVVETQYTASMRLEVSSKDLVAVELIRAYRVNSPSSTLNHGSAVEWVKLQTGIKVLALQGLTPSTETLSMTFRLTYA